MSDSLPLDIFIMWDEVAVGVAAASEQPMMAPNIMTVAKTIISSVSITLAMACFRMANL